MCGHVWAFVGMCGHVWECVGMCGHVWACVLRGLAEGSRSQNLLCEDARHLPCPAEGSGGTASQDAHQSKSGYYRMLCRNATAIQCKNDPTCTL